MLDLRSRSVGVVLVVALILATAACGDDGTTTTAGGGDPDATTTTSGKADRTDGSGGNAAASLEVSGTAWYAGYKITVESARTRPSATPGEPDGIELAMRFENEATADGTPAFEWSLEANDTAWPYSASDLPSIPGNAASNGSVSFEPTEDVDLATATLVIGGAESNQSRLPLGGVGDAVTNEPQTTEVDAEVVAGALSVQIESIGVRFDDPEYHQQAPVGKGWLTISYAATDASDSGYAFGETTTRLETPDDLRLAPDNYPNEYITAGSSVPDLFSTFEVDLAEVGTYGFILIRTEGGGESNEGSYTFDLPLA